MYREEILTTVHMAHYFDSAFTTEEVLALLRVSAKRETFELTVQELKSAGMLMQRDNMLYARDLETDHLRQKESSRQLFVRYRSLLKGLSNLPWVRFLALTGANAFESCREDDDIDLFVITRRGRLWITYLLMVIFSKFVGQRQRLCINYLVDEEHLRIPQENYFTAVQIVRMIPLLETPLGQNLLAANSWVYDYLPNASRSMLYHPVYLLGKGRQSTGEPSEKPGFLDWLNRKIYHGYCRRLKQKYPEAFGHGIVLREGAAKLNRINHQNIYDKIFQEIESEIAS